MRDWDKFMPNQPDIRYMAQAICQNTDCEREKWKLTKPPESYSGGGPSCPDCGTTRVDIEYDQGESPHQAQTETRGRAPVAQEQQSETGLASQQHESAGDAIAKAFLGLTKEETSTKEKIQVAGQVASVAQDTLTRIVEYNEQIEEQRQERAQNVNLEKKEDLPSCPYCGSTIEEIPLNANKVNCPNCGEPLEVTAA